MPSRDRGVSLAGPELRRRPHLELKAIESQTEALIQRRQHFVLPMAQGGGGAGMVGVDGERPSAQVGHA